MPLTDQLLCLKFIVKYKPAVTCAISQADNKYLFFINIDGTWIVKLCGHIRPRQFLIISEINLI